MERHDNFRVQMTRPKRFSWSKFVVVILAALILLAAAFGLYAYMALRPMAKAESTVQRVVKDKTSLTNLHDLTVDYRDGTTYAVLGTQDGKQKVAVMHGKNGQVKVFDYGKGLSEKSLKNKLQDQYAAKRIYSANLSEYQNTLVWEVSYQSKDGSLNYLTLDYQNGTVYRAVNGI